MASRQGLSSKDSESGLPSSGWFFLRALSPFTPKSPLGALGRGFQSGAGFTIFGRLATLSFV
jgi:hypothetical protein